MNSDDKFAFGKPWKSLDEGRPLTVRAVKPCLDIADCHGLTLYFDFPGVTGYAGYFDYGALCAVANLFKSGESRSIEIVCNPDDVEELHESVVIETAKKGDDIKVSLQYGAGFTFVIHPFYLSQLGGWLDRIADKWHKR